MDSPPSRQSIIQNPDVIVSSSPAWITPTPVSLASLLPHCTFNMLRTLLPLWCSRHIRLITPHHHHHQLPLLYWLAVTNRTTYKVDCLCYKCLYHWLPVTNCITYKLKCVQCLPSLYSRLPFSCHHHIDSLTTLFSCL